MKTRSRWRFVHMAMLRSSRTPGLGSTTDGSRQASPDARTGETPFGSRPYYRDAAVTGSYSALDRSSDTCVTMTGCLRPRVHSGQPRQSRRQLMKSSQLGCLPHWWKYGCNVRICRAAGRAITEGVASQTPLNSCLVLAS